MLIYLCAYTCDNHYDVLIAFLHKKKLHTIIKLYIMLSCNWSLMITPPFTIILIIEFCRMHCTVATVCIVCIDLYITRIVVSWTTTHSSFWVSTSVPSFKGSASIIINVCNYIILVNTHVN